MSVTKYVGEEALQELVTKMKAYTDNKEITLDDSVTQNSSNGVKSSGIYTALTAKQDTIDSSHKLSSDLVSDTNNTNKFVTTSEKNTWNAKQNALTFDSAPTNSSTNPVTSGGVYTALSGKQDVLTFDTTPTSSSTNPVTSGGVYTALDGKVDKITGKGLSTDDFVSTNYYTKTQVDGMVSAVYKPAGSVAFASLPTLAASVLGNVYNVTDAFTTTSDFVEGSGNSYPAGTNVVVISPSSGTYKFDVLAGFVDLSGYVPTTRKVNNKALSSDITLDASDVGALASNTTYVSSVNGSSGAVTGIQTTSNLVTSFNSTTSDSKYPSEKLVKTSLDAKQDTMTAITTAEVDALFS